MKKNIIKILIILGLLLFIVFDIMYLMGCYVSLKFLIEDNLSSTTIDVIYNFVDKGAFFCTYIVLQLSVILYSYYGLKSNSKQDIIGTSVMKGINDMTIGLFTFLIFSLIICCLMALFIHKRPITNDK